MESTDEPLPGRPTEQPVVRRGRAPKPRRWIIVAVALVVGLGALFVATSLWTDRPQFCGTCHEMRPYVEAWAKGPHKDVWCVDCHVGRGYPARFAHKFVALQEVLGHFSGDTKFPLPVEPRVTDAQCKTCHSKVTPKLTASGFNHNEHESKAACQACHAEAGHSVSQGALVAVAAFNPAVTRTPLSGTTATVGHGSANISGHVEVACTRCHDMKKTGCSACHTYSAGHFKAASGSLPPCTVCHKAGSNWGFTHPVDQDCQTCHTPSATHFKPISGKLTPCSQCHAHPGANWTFSHPAASANCANCHAVPAKHFKPASGTLTPCSQCHLQAGVSWKFAHPGSSANCQACHTPPSGHSPGQCSQCHHKTGVSFAFVHPSSGAPHGIGGRACVTCHPNGYTTHSCTCHGGGSGN